MNPANYREALVELGADESEGADILLVSMSLCFSTSHLMPLFHAIVLF